MRRFISRFSARHSASTLAALLAFATLLPLAAAQESASNAQETASEATANPQEKSPEGSTETQAKKSFRELEAKLNAIVEKLDALVEKKTKAPAQTAKPKEPKPEEPKAAPGDSPDAATQATAAPKTESPAAEAPAGPRQGAPRGGQGRPGGRNRETPKQPVSLKLAPEQLAGVPWRALGPANMSGRITDLAVHPQDPSLWYFATASGGLLRSENRGLTIEYQFDHESAISVGCLALDPTRKDTIWVGTGEANPRNSVSYGNGVYKSTDGGKTWKNMGLPESYQIGRILIDPTAPDTVYVGALGRLYGPNRQRGVYKTTDGGENWEQVLFIDDSTGATDMIMNPEDPNTIIVAMWDRLRDGFDGWPGSEPKPDGIDGYDPIRKWGPGAGLYKTTDAGANWKKLSNGLPPSKLGRVGLDWQTGGSHAIYAIIDCEDIGKGPKPHTTFLGLVGKDTDAGVEITQVLPESPAAEAGAQAGDRLVEVEGQAVEQFEQLSAVLREKKLGARITLKLRRGDSDIDISTKLAARPGSRQQVPTVWLGATGGDQDGKLVLQSISEAGPAEKAGLQDGDVILKVDGKAPESYAKLVESIREMSEGDKLELSVSRNKKTLELTVTLENRPARGPTQQSPPIMGVQGEDAEGGGATLTTITKDGPSDKAGLKDGDVVKKVEGKPLENYAALLTEIRSRRPDDKLKVSIVRGEEKLELTVKLGDRNADSAGDRPYTYSYYGQSPNAQDMQGSDGYKYGGVYKSSDAGETWTRVNSLNVRPMYFSVIRVDPNDENRVYVLGVSQFQSTNGGLTFSSDLGRGVHADAHDLWVDPSDGRHMVIGCDGGFYETYDYGNNWDHINAAAIGQFYHVAISLKEPYWVVGGLQDNGSWAGPAVSRQGGALNEDWLSIGGGDGFVCQVDPNDPDLVYYESQNGAMGRRHLKTGERASIRPRPEQGIETRFNWKTPFILSNFNSKIFYCAGNYVYRSLDRGNDLQRISPEITLTQRGSATALAESPRASNVMYVGTDDGALWVTQDSGQNWENITENLNAPGPLWVSTIEASRFADGRVYVSLDGHRSDDDSAYAYVSEDYGKTFKPLHRDLPVGSTRCLREDISNENLLYLGTEYAFWVSVDRGRHWTQFNQTLPTVAIHDLAMHPTNGEIVLATHGRSLWAGDVSGLRELDASNFEKEVALYKPTPAIRWRREPSRGGTNRRFIGQNPASGAAVWYSLPKDVKSVALRIDDISGNQIAEVQGKKEAGLHLLRWNLARTSPAPGAGQPQRGGRRGPGGNSPVPSGDYRITLVVDGEEKQSQILSVASDPGLAPGAVSDEEFAFQELLEASESEEEDGTQTPDRSDD